MENRVISQLIGLARSIEGNEDLVTEVTDRLVIDALAATYPDEQTTQELLDRIGEEKLRIVPGCYYCASPCGRTAPYDLHEIEAAGEEIAQIKYALLDALHHIALQQKMPLSETAAFLRRGLSIVGMDWEAERLRAVLQEAEAFLK